MFIRETAWNCTGKYLASGSSDKTAAIFSVKSGRLVRFVDELSLERGSCEQPRGRLAWSHRVSALVPRFVHRAPKRLHLYRMFPVKVRDIELKGHTESVDQLCWNPVSRPQCPAVHSSTTSLECRHWIRNASTGALQLVLHMDGRINSITVR